MSDCTPTPDQAALALQEVSERRAQVRAAQPPRWIGPLAGAALVTNGVVMDLWPQARTWNSWIVLAVVLVVIFVSRTRAGGSALGYRVAPNLTYRGFWSGANRRGYAVGFGLIALMTVGYPLLQHYDVRWPNTVVAVVVAAGLIAGTLWMYGTRRSPASPADVR